MKTYVVYLNILKSSFFGFKTKTVSQRVEIDSFDIVQASALARLTYGGEVSMIWPKWEKQIQN